MTTEQIHSEKHPLLDQLQELLQTQMDRLRNGQVSDTEAAVDRAEAVIAEIDARQILKQPIYYKQGKAIVKMYRQLVLMIEAEKDQVNSQLVKIAGGKKTLRAYNQNV